MACMAKVTDNNIPWHELGYGMAADRHSSIWRDAFCVENARLTLPKLDSLYILILHIGSVVSAPARAVNILSNTVRATVAPILRVKFGGAANGLSRLYLNYTAQSAHRSTLLTSRQRSRRAPLKQDMLASELLSSDNRCARCQPPPVLKSTKFRSNHPEFFEETAF